MTAVRLTPARRRALTILRDHPERTASAFAVLMWPDSKGHATRSHRHSTPAGGAVGAGIKMTAGAFLWRLWAQGYVTMRKDLTSALWSISAFGRECLEAAL